MKTLIVFLAFLPFTLATGYAPKGQILPKVTRNDLQMIVGRYAFVYDVPERVLFSTLFCESSMRTDATNFNQWEESYGISQINLKAHKDISKEEALDPDFAIRYMAKEIHEGRGRAWTCFAKM